MSGSVKQLRRSVNDNNTMSLIQCASSLPRILKALIWEHTTYFKIELIFFDGFSDNEITLL